MVFFFYGKNTYASRQKLAEMRAKYIEKAGGDFGLEQIDGESVSAEQLRAMLGAVPFLASSRLVIIEHLSRNKAIAKDIEAILPAIAESTVTVFFEEDVDKRGKLYKTLIKEAKAVEFSPLSEAKLGAWLRREARARGAEIDEAAVKLLTDMCGDDQWRLGNELIKLANHTGHIKPQDVKELVETGPEQTIFDLVDCISEGRLKPALAAYQDLRSQQAAEIYILTMIIWQLRNLLFAKAAGNIQPAQLAKEAGMSPYVAKKAMARQRSFSERQLKEAFLRALETDYAIKTGAGKPDLLMEQLIQDLVSAAHQRA